MKKYLIYYYIEDEVFECELIAENETDLFQIFNDEFDGVLLFYKELR